MYVEYLKILSPSNPRAIMHNITLFLKTPTQDPDPNLSLDPNSRSHTIQRLVAQWYRVSTIEGATPELSADQNVLHLTNAASRMIHAPSSVIFENYVLWSTGVW